MTDHAVALLLRFPRGELTLPLVALRFIDVDPDHKAGGVRLTTPEGRRVVVGSAKQTEELANALRPGGDDRAPVSIGASSPTEQTRTSRCRTWSSSAYW